MKKYIIVLLAVSALVLSSCDSYNSIVNKHNELIDKWNNNVVNPYNNAVNQ